MLTKPQFSKCSPLTGSTSNTWECARNEHLGPWPRPTEAETLRIGETVLWSSPAGSHAHWSLGTTELTNRRREWFLLAAGGLLWGKTNQAGEGVCVSLTGPRQSCAISESDSTSPQRTCAYLNSWKWNKIQSPVSQPHWPYFKRSKAMCGVEHFHHCRIFYWMALISREKKGSRKVPVQLLDSLVESWFCLSHWRKKSFLLSAGRLIQQDNNQGTTNNRLERSAEILMSICTLTQPCVCFCPFSQVLLGCGF